MSMKKGHTRKKKRTRKNTLQKNSVLSYQRVWDNFKDYNFPLGLEEIIKGKFLLAKRMFVCEYVEIPDTKH